MADTNYGCLCSVRHQAKKTSDLINAICAKFGNSITWSLTGYHFIERPSKYVIYFRRHGNKFADWVKFLSYDIDVLREIKQSFPNDFKGDVETKQGEL